jgi:predicted acylesterase/phospholipase RssA
MGRTARTNLTAVLLAGLTAFGCRLNDRRTVPFTPPHAQPLAPADHPEAAPGGVTPVKAMSPVPGCLAPFDAASADQYPMRRPRHVLALSGGGAYGAYSAGFIDGWTRQGNRPEFDVVTGISTGSLIAPYAFLGPEYDARLGQLYTRIQAADIFRIRAWVTIPYRDSVATSDPLKQLLDSQITPELMTRIAAEHRKGRRLYVGTTNLDSRRLVVWDMGAIASRPCPEGCQLFRDVLLASSAVPGMMPPVEFGIEVDGKPATELHADGGISAQLFVPSHVFAAAAAAAASDPNLPLGDDPNPPAGNLYVIVAGKLYPDAAPVRPRVLPVLGATANTLLYAYCRADLANLYGLSRSSGMKYHLTALGQGFRTLENSVDFDQKQMQKLFDEGQRQGTAGPAWMHGPPTLSPGDGDYIRTGLRFRTPPEPPLAPGQ